MDGDRAIFVTRDGACVIYGGALLGQLCVKPWMGIIISCSTNRSTHLEEKTYIHAMRNGKRLFRLYAIHKQMSLVFLTQVLVLCVDARVGPAARNTPATPLCSSFSGVGRVFAETYSSVVLMYSWTSGLSPGYGCPHNGNILTVISKLLPRFTLDLEKHI